MKGSIVSIFHIKNYSFILILQTDLPTLSIKIIHHRSCCLFFFIFFHCNYLGICQWNFLSVFTDGYDDDIFSEKNSPQLPQIFFYRDFKLSCQFRYSLRLFLSINLIHKSWHNFSLLANPMISMVTQIKRKGTPFFNFGYWLSWESISNSPEKKLCQNIMRSKSIRKGPDWKINQTQLFSIYI